MRYHALLFHIYIYIYWLLSYGNHLSRLAINQVVCVCYHRAHQASMTDGTRGRSANRNGAGPLEPPIPIDPTGLLDALVRRIERASNNVGNNNHATHPPRQTGDKLLERFRALQPEKFDGMMEPWRAE